MTSVMSVQGEIREDALGFTLPHEHLFVDLRFYSSQESDEKVTPANRPLVVNQPWKLRDNAILDDLESAVEEALAFKSMGGRTIADLSPSPRMGRNPRGLRLVAKSAGVNILMAAGRYSEPSMSEPEKQEDIDTIEARLFKEFKDGAEDGIHPGLLKAAFVSTIDKEPEIRTLRAAARVQSKVGCALAVHPHIWEPDSHQLLDILEEEGCDLRRVILCHQDTLGHQADYIDSLAKRGAFIEFDTFGSGWINDRMWQLNDEVKIGYIKKQVEIGNAGQILISGDMCLKLMRTRWGGNGLAYIPSRLIPAMLGCGCSVDLVRQITIENPKKAFCH